MLKQVGFWVIVAILLIVVAVIFGVLPVLFFGISLTLFYFGLTLGFREYMLASSAVFGLLGIIFIFVDVGF